MRRFTSRKFILSILSLVASTGALLLGKLDGASWVATIGIIVGAYHAANVTTKHITTTTTTEGQ